MQTWSNSTPLRSPLPCSSKIEDSDSDQLSREEFGDTIPIPQIGSPRRARSPPYFPTGAPSPARKNSGTRYLFPPRHLPYPPRLHLRRYCVGQPFPQRPAQRPIAPERSLRVRRGAHVRPHPVEGVHRPGDDPARHFQAKWAAGLDGDGAEVVGVAACDRHGIDPSNNLDEPGRETHVAATKRCCQGLAPRRSRTYAVPTSSAAKPTDYRP